MYVNDNKTDLEKEDNRGNDDFESDMSMAVKVERVTPSPDDNSQESLGLSSFDRKFIYHYWTTLSLYSVSNVSAIDQNLTAGLNNATQNLLAIKSPTDHTIKKIIEEETWIL